MVRSAAATEEIEMCASIYGEEMTDGDGGEVMVTWCSDPSLCAAGPASLKCAGPWVDVRVLPCDAADAHVGVRMRVVMPAGYPDAPPVVAWYDTKGMDATRTAQLGAEVQACIEANTGAPMAYLVIEAAREWLRGHNEALGDGSAYEEMLRRQRDKERQAEAEKERAQTAGVRVRGVAAGAAAAEDAVKKKTAGHTPVTPEAFAVWRAAFDAEHPLLSQRVRVDKDGKRKLTGKELFETDLAAAMAMAADAELDTDSGTAALSPSGPDVPAAAAAAARTYAIDASLFAGEDDLDDLDDEDDEDYEDEDEDGDDDDDDDDDDADDDDEE